MIYFRFFPQFYNSDLEVEITFLSSLVFIISLHLYRTSYCSGEISSLNPNVLDDVTEQDGRWGRHELPMHLCFWHFRVHLVLDNFIFIDFFDIRKLLFFHFKKNNKKLPLFVIALWLQVQIITIFSGYVIGPAWVHTFCWSGSSILDIEVSGSPTGTWECWWMTG